MSILPPSVLDALHADPSLWPGEMTDAQRKSFERAFGGWPADVRAAILSSLVDPERNDWSRAATWGLLHAATAGAQVTGLCTDDALEMKDARGERFALQPLGFRLPADPWGSRPDLVRLLKGLDAAFDHRRYVLAIRKPIPAGLEVEPICHLVRLWLVEIDRGERHERNAVYESEDRMVSFEVTLVEGEHARGGRVTTFGPLLAYERLVEVGDQLAQAAARIEESVGQLPLVMALAADRPWRISRGHVQERLLGMPERVTVGADGVYEAEFSVGSRWSLFSDPAYRTIAAVWWLEPAPQGGRSGKQGGEESPGPLSFRGSAYDNPWSPALLALKTRGARFVPVGEPDRSRRVVLRWREDG